jgi:hypothetical protein
LEALQNHIVSLGEVVVNAEFAGFNKDDDDDSDDECDEGTGLFYEDRHYGWDKVTM